MEERILYEKILVEALSKWQEMQGDNGAYSFAIETCGFCRYKLSLYYYGEYKQVISSFMVHTNNIHELIHKLQNGVRENANNQ